MRRLLLTSLLLSLPVAAKEPPQLPSQLAATHGYVHVAFPKGGAQVLTVKPVGKGKPQRLLSYIGGLPAYIAACDDGVQSL